mmetsp:Transcript_31415/g.45202  ORF Transcript_31415/g.45202 Transcript_31415/m.45202 type:complete len:209 (+) Transcript_31415:241-867(+)
MFISPILRSSDEFDDAFELECCIRFEEMTCLRNSDIVLIGDVPPKPRSELGPLSAVMCCAEYVVLSKSDEVLLCPCFGDDIGFICLRRRTDSAFKCLLKSSSNTAVLITGGVFLILFKMRLFSKLSFSVCNFLSTSFKLEGLTYFGCGRFSDICFAIFSIIFALSFAIRCRLSSINCCFFGRKAKCFKPNDSGADVLTIGVIFRTRSK